MRDLTIKISRSVVWLTVVICLLAGISPQLFPQSGNSGDLYLVLLQEPSVIQRFASPDSLSTRQGRPGWKSLAASRYSDELARRQREFIGKYEALAESKTSRREGAVVYFESQGGRTHLLNVVFARVSADLVEAMREDPEVRGVYPSDLRYPLMDTLPGIVGAEVAWETLGGADNAGKGIKIGIIDSGIDVSNPLFRGDGMAMPPGYPKQSEHLDFINGKVIVARSYHDQFLNPQENETPEDELGHGTRVAAVAGGRFVQAPLADIRGIAPAAFLGNYKVFGTPGVNSSATSAAIIAALDDAVTDGMDIINLSLGGSARDPEQDPEQMAIAAAVDAGVVVVVSAGNSGPDPWTITSPGTSPEAVTVGAVSNGRIYASGIRNQSASGLPADLELIAYKPGSGVVIESAIGPFPLALPGSFSDLACSPFTSGSFDGRIVLVRRGTCAFQIKADNVFAAGAEAMIVYDNQESGPVLMGFEERGPGGPAVSILKNQGEQLRALLLAGSRIDTVIERDDRLFRFPAQADILASFSSRGPSLNHLIKPDLTAVGAGVYTSLNPLLSQGTSFSSPVVAGAAALLRQAHPQWSARSIKSALVGTASGDVIRGGKKALMIDTGAGRLDLTRALKVRTTVDPVSLSFGMWNNPPTVPQTEALILTNHSSQPLTVDLTVEMVRPHPSMDLALSAGTVSLAPLSSRTVEICAVYSKPFTGGIFEGHVWISPRTSDSSAVEIKVPIWGGLNLEDSATLAVSSGPGADFTSLEEALRLARPGNTIVLRDSEIYSSRLVIGYNEEGLPLNGLTIRAGEGAFPVVDAGNPASGAVISIEDVDRVTIEGLYVRGGLQGIRFNNASGSVIDTIVESNPESSTGYGISATNSRINLYGDTIRRTGGSGIALFSSDALLQQSKVGGPQPWEANGGHGIYISLGSNVGAFDNQISNSGNYSDSQGIRISSAAAILKGNSITDSKGKLGDGVLIRGALAEVLAVDNAVASNERSGFSLFDRANVSLNGNEISNNRESGLFCNSASTVLGSRLFLRTNGTGILASECEVSLSDSLIVESSTSGLEAADSSLDLRNLTVFGNGSTGLRIQNPVRAALSNSVVSNHTSEDLVGFQVDDVYSNLIGDGLFSGLNANFSADPRLDGDYNPMENSPVIDRGDNREVKSELDFHSHLRIVNGSGKSEAVADLGAIEHLSSHAVPLILPVLKISAGDFVGLALTNARKPDPDPEKTTDVILNAFLPSGAFHGRQTVSIPAGSQAAFFIGEIFPDLDQGWIEILPDNPHTVGFMTVGNQDWTQLDGAPVFPVQGSRIIFPEIRTSGSDRTTFCVINPESEGVLVHFDWHPPGGQARSSSRWIPARGMTRTTFGELFGDGGQGYVVVRSESGSGLYGLEFFGDDSSEAVLPGLDPNRASDVLTGAQLAYGPDIDTFINLVNLGTANVVNLSAIAEDGRSIGKAGLELGSGQQLRISARELFGSDGKTFVGWLHVVSGSGDLIGSIVFEECDGRYSAALPMQAVGAREFIFSHVAQSENVFTGITLLNPGTEPALISLEVFTASGEKKGFTLREIKPSEKRALLLSEWIPILTNQLGGFVRVRSNVQIQGFELFGSHQYLAAVPRLIIAE